MRRRSGGRQRDRGKVANERKQEQKPGGQAMHMFG